MKKRLSASVLAFVMCLTFLQPVAGLAVNAPETATVTGWAWACGEDQQEPVLNEESGQWELTVSIRDGKFLSAEELEALLPAAISATVVSRDSEDAAENGGQEDVPQPDDTGEPTTGEDSAGGSEQNTEPPVSGDGEDHSGAPEADAGTTEPTEPAESGGSDQTGDEAEPPDAVTDGGETPEESGEDAGPADAGEGNSFADPGMGDGTSVSDGEALPGGGPGEDGSNDSEPAGTNAPGTPLPGGEEDADNTDASDPVLVSNGEDGTGEGADEPGEPAEPAVGTRLELTWNLSSYLRTLPLSGDVLKSYELTAALPKGYELFEGVPTPKLTVIFSEAESRPATKEELESHTVPGVEMPGTVVNMFDYWLGETRYNGHELNPTGYSDNNHSATLGKADKIKGAGINEDKTLVFSNGTNNGFNDKKNNYNYWNSDKPYAPFSYRENKELVTRTLPKDGYPAIRLDWNNAVKPTPESLDYLFNPKNKELEEHKSAFPNVTGLFQIDEDGYYYYDARENYAYLDEDEGKITLYDKPGVSDGNSSGQFFPFDNPVDQKIFLIDENGELEMNPDVHPRPIQIQGETRQSYLNHYFGMTMTTRFKQVNEGKTWNGNAMTYEFAGDDDVWLYIDDVLIADLGGLHNSVSLTVDFSTGRILVYSTEFPVDTPDKKVFLNTTIREQFEAAGKNTNNNGDWSGDTFADNTYHTLKFFYLERGNSASNLKLRFNLHPIPESELLKVDQGDKGIAGATFELYAADENYTYDSSKLLYTDTTDADGYLSLKDKNDAPISFQQLAEENSTNHFVLKETKVPDGYRQPAEVRLRLENGVIFSEDKWATGTYAQAKVTTTAPSKVSYGSEVIDLADLGTKLKDTVMFAVILKRVDMNKPIDDGANWVPVYGDALTGWHVMKDSSLDSVLQAAVENPYRFHVATNGSFQVEIEDLPGDVKEYYSMLGQDEKGEARYTVAYYYTEAENLDGATADNTHRLNTDDFLREFSVKLYIPNPRNRLVVQKVDDGHPLSGAGFALYAEKDITVYDDGTYNIDNNAQPYDEVTTEDLTKESGSWLELEGAGVFPSSGKDLKSGTYYLVELEPPAGYKENPIAVKVIVNDTGVYADAGSEDDGVSVQRGVGRLMRSMLQFAANDDIDATLHDVKAQLLTANGSEPGKEGTTWTEWQNENADELHLRYDSADETLAYVPADGFTEEYLSTETGWSKLEIRQCMDHDEDLGGAYKQELGKQDLANLFSGVVIVQVEDKKTSEGTSALTITKYVKGTGADTNQNFDFTVQLDKPLNGWYGAMFFENGIAAFTLSNGDTITATGLPDGTEYTVTETNAEGYEVTYTNQSGTLKDDQTAAVIVTNTKETPVPEPEPKTGLLTVSKVVVDGDGTYLSDDTTEFRFEITLTGADGEPINGEFSYTGGVVQNASGVTKPDDGTLQFKSGKALITLKHGQTITINDLPADTTYSVVEDTASGYEVEHGTVSGTIQAEAENSASFINTKVDDPGPGPEPDPGEQTGSLMVSKKVEGDGDRSKDFKFQITLTGVDGQPLSGTFHYDGAKTGTIQSGGTIALKHGESITIHGIPADTAYQVEELGADGYKVTSEGTVGTIPAEGTVTAAFTNTRNDEPAPDPDPDPDDPVGNLALSKTVRGDDRDGTFTFQVTFTTKDGSQITERFYYNGDRTGTIGSGETVTLADGESITIRNIPAGTHYQVEELNAEGYEVISSGETGRIPENETVQVSFINTWNDTPDQPADPDGPDDPKNPNTPDDPDIPPDPDIPDDPNGPNTPDVPDDPSTPDNPDEPNQPDEPDIPNDPGTPKTDDPRRTDLWAALCLLSLGGMGLLASTGNGIKRKKR
ncbi:DUF7601 domain-containing protein [Dysosmobacter sp.]|uniref:DUF7601 domain-containing protein n=1 Tax=Dysosmobacter sp. TaxID=2591382 RepID=UPI003AF0C4A3